MKPFCISGFVMVAALILAALTGCSKKLTEAEMIAYRTGMEFPAGAEARIVKPRQLSQSGNTYLRLKLNHAQFEFLLKSAPFDRISREETTTPMSSLKEPVSGWDPELDAKGIGGLVKMREKIVVYFFDVRKPEQIEGWLVVSE